MNGSRTDTETPSNTVAGYRKSTLSCLDRFNSCSVVVHAPTSSECVIFSRIPGDRESRSVDLRHRNASFVLQFARGRCCRDLYLKRPINW